MFLQYAATDRRFFFAAIITVVVSICLHELSHGIVAIAFGDRTPIERGHMTLNPFVHMGIFSLILLLLAGIAWGSMPVDPRRLRGRHSDAVVALAGPACNILLAIFACVTLGLWQRFGPSVDTDENSPAGNAQFLLWTFGWVNFALAMFNLIPVPPLDGSRVVASFSRSFGTMTAGARMTGGFAGLFIVVFMFAGRLISPAANSAALKCLTYVRGW